MADEKKQVNGTPGLDHAGTEVPPLSPIVQEEIDFGRASFVAVRGFSFQPLGASRKREVEQRLRTEHRLHAIGACSHPRAKKAVRERYWSDNSNLLYHVDSSNPDSFRPR